VAAMGAQSHACDDLRQSAPAPSAGPWPPGNAKRGSSGASAVKSSKLLVNCRSVGANSALSRGIVASFSSSAPMACGGPWRGGGAHRNVRVHDSECDMRGRPHLAVWRLPRRLRLEHAVPVQAAEPGVRLDLVDATCSGRARARAKRAVRCHCVRQSASGGGRTVRTQALVGVGDEALEEVDGLC